MADLAVEAGHLDPEDDGVGARFVRDDELVVRTLAAHAPALLRTARRFSVCADDAQEAYARATEIFLRRAGSLRGETVVGWLHQVVRNEALAVRRARLRLVGAEEPDLDAHEAEHGPSPEERVERRDRTERAAEALAGLKPHEALALWLKAEGLSYQEIAQRQGWTYTKVNRCIAEGRRAFLIRYAGLESGEACRRFEPALSALLDGEAKGRELTELRRHLRRCAGCRATLRELRSGNRSLGIVLPLSAGVGALGAVRRHVGLLARLHDLLAGTPERVSGSLVRWQGAIEAASAPKLAAVAVTVAAAAGGGAATVAHSSASPPRPRAVAPARPVEPTPAATTAEPPWRPVVAPRPAAERPAKRHRAVRRVGQAATPPPPLEASPAPPPSQAAAAPAPKPAPPPPTGGRGAEFGVEGSP